MKRLISIAILLSVWSGSALADHIGIYTDQAANDCVLTNLQLPPARNFFYIAHKFNPGGATAVHLKVADNSGLFFETASTPYIATGTWNTDLRLAFGGCVVGQHVLMTLNFLWFGQPMDGCAHTLHVVAGPLSPSPGEVVVLDCSQPNANVRPVSGGTARIVAQRDQCESPCSPIPVSGRTWGGVKALYQ